MGYLHIDEEPNERAHVPTAALAIAGVFAVFTIALAGFARASDSGTLGASSQATPVMVRALLFSDRPDGSVGVYDARQNQELAPLEGSGGFVRGALRALARQRRLADVGPEVPFYLIKWSDGRLTLEDSSTSNHLELQAYGSTNTQTFEALLSHR